MTPSLFNAHVAKMYGKATSTYSPCIEVCDIDEKQPSMM